MIEMDQQKSNPEIHLKLLEILRLKLSHICHSTMIVDVITDGIIQYLCVSTTVMNIVDPVSSL